MDGLFAFMNHSTHDTRTCRFPYGSSQCKRVLQKLRRSDPPFDDQGVPPNPIETIAPEDRPLAYHFLVRALFHMLARETPQPNDAVPYLMAFSTLAQIRFALIEVRPAIHGGLDIMATQLDETDFDMVQQIFGGMMMPPSGVVH